MIEIKDLCKHFTIKGKKIEALNDINIKVEDGEIFGIVGLSGAGKSTLVRCINYLERPTSGQVIIDGKDLGTMSDKELRQLRHRVSMIFQSFNLLEQRTALQNICYPMEIAGWKRADAKKHAMELLKTVALEDRADAYPSQLSGGQKQRVAIARALALDPKVLLCDEATSALDPETTASILRLLKRINQNMGVTIVIITHEMSVVDQICDRMAVLDNSRVVEMGKVKEIFIHPKSEMAKRLINPEETSVLTDGPGKVFRIVFDGKSTNKPVVATLAKEFNICVSVLSAEQRVLNGKVFGQMVIQAPDDNIASERVAAYLRDNNISFVEEG